MTGDIKLDGDWVTVEGKWTRVRTWDLMLDAQDRRSNGSGWRRALVHDHHDGLTINYGSDYPGGVKIRGKTHLESLEADDLSCPDLKAGRLAVGGLRLAQSTLNAVVLGDSAATDVMQLEGPGLRIEGRLRVYQAARFDEAVRTPDVTIAPERPHGDAGDDPRYNPFSLVERLQELQTQIKELQRHVKALQQRVANP